MKSKVSKLKRKLRRASILLHLTKKCPYRCKHCYLKAGKALPNELTRAEILKLLDELSSLTNSARMVLSGGEPTERRDLIKIITSCKEKDFEVLVNTNGFYINENLAKNLRIVDKVDLALYGYKKSHDEFVRKKSFWKAIEAAENLEKEDVNFNLSYLLHRNNLEFFPKLLDLIDKRLKSPEEHSIGFFTFCPFGRGRNLERPSRKEIKEFAKKVKKIRSKIKTINYAKIVKIKELLEREAPFCEFYEVNESDVLSAWAESRQKTKEIISELEPKLKIPEKLTHRIKNLKINVGWCSTLRRASKSIIDLTIYPNGEVYLCPMGEPTKISDFLKVGNVRKGLKKVVKKSQSSALVKLQKNRTFSNLAEKQGKLEKELAQSDQCFVCIDLLRSWGRLFS